jgi:hypothetical protein
VLSTPPAFALSQDQTLMFLFLNFLSKIFSQSSTTPALSILASNFTWLLLLIIDFSK